MRNTLLLLGGALIIASGLYTLTHLTDTVVFAILVPGIVVGLILIGVSVALNRDRGRGSEADARAVRRQKG